MLSSSICISTDAFVSLVSSRKALPELLLVLKFICIKSWKNSRKLPITGSEFSNVVGSTLF